MSITGQEKLEFIFSRRSVRAYSPGEIADSDIKSLLEGAMAAPSAMTKDPWRFIVIRNREVLAKLPSLLPGGGMLPTAAAAILVCGDLDMAFERHISYLLQDCSAATENLLLAATALGLGSCWVGVHPSESSVGKVKELFELPPAVIPVAIVALGPAAEQPEPRTRYNPASVHAEKW